MIVVVIIGLLAAMAIPAFGRVREKALTSRILNDYRTFSQAFEQYAMENGVYPPNAGAGTVPAGLTSALQVSVWKAPTPIGGNWNYDRNVNVSVGISISGAVSGRLGAQMRKLDAAIDDGDLTAGRFRRFSDRCTLILEP